MEAADITPRPPSEASSCIDVEAINEKEVIALPSYQGDLSSSNLATPANNDVNPICQAAIPDDDDDDDEEAPLRFCADRAPTVLRETSNLEKQSYSSSGARLPHTSHQQSALIANIDEGPPSSNTIENPAKDAGESRHSPVPSTPVILQPRDNPDPMAFQICVRDIDEEFIRRQCSAWGTSGYESGLIVSRLANLGYFRAITFRYARTSMDVYMAYFCYYCLQSGSDGGRVDGFHQHWWGLTRPTRCLLNTADFYRYRGMTPHNLFGSMVYLDVDRSPNSLCPAPTPAEWEILRSRVEGNLCR